MHLQVKTIIPGTGFEDDVLNESASYHRGSFGELLGILADGGFNIRGASGRHIEFGGEFTFWCGAPGSSDDDANHASTEAAAQLLRDHNYDARVIEVSAAWLDDTTGTLREFVEAIRRKGLWIEEVTVGTPDDQGRIPVQVFTSKT